MFGTTEIILIAIVALVLFGPDKLPEFARNAGKAMAAFKRAQKEAELATEFAEFDLSGFDYYKEKHEEEKKAESNLLHEKIEKMAKSHGIETENKTTEELINLIDEKIAEKEVKEAEKFEKQFENADLIRNAIEENKTETK